MTIGEIAARRLEEILGESSRERNFWIRAGAAALGVLIWLLGGVFVSSTSPELMRAFVFVTSSRTSAWIFAATVLVLWGMFTLIIAEGFTRGRLLKFFLLGLTVPALVMAILRVAFSPG